MLGNSLFLNLLEGLALLLVLVVLLKQTGRNVFGNFKNCPHCGEQIRREARVCRYCQRDV